MRFVVSSVVVIVDRETGRSKGFGFVEYTTDEAAETALAQMNGRVLPVLPASEFLLKLMFGG